MNQFNAWKRVHYWKERAKRLPAKEAYQNAVALANWELLEGEGVVKREIVPDECNLEFLDEASYTTTREGIALAKYIRQVAEDEGCWGCVTYWREDVEDEWEVGGSIWGFVGDKHAQDNEYWPQLCQLAIEGYLRRLRFSA